MESGTPGVKRTDDGWLNRALQGNCRNPSLRRFAPWPWAQILPLTLRGSASAIAIPDLKQFRVFGNPQQITEGGFEGDVRADASTRRCTASARKRSKPSTRSRNSIPIIISRKTAREYPKSRFGQSLQQIAQLIKADIGMEVAFLDTGGWDNHVNEGGVQGQLSNLLRDLGQGLAAFHQDMGDRMDDVVFVTMSEFGRTAHENGNRGTDHGHANCMFVMGGQVKGGKVYTQMAGHGRRSS